MRAIGLRTGCSTGSDPRRFTSPGICGSARIPAAAPSGDISPVVQPVPPQAVRAPQLQLPKTRWPQQLQQHSAKSSHGDTVPVLQPSQPKQVQLQQPPRWPPPHRPGGAVVSGPSPVKFRQQNPGSVQAPPQGQRTLQKQHSEDANILRRQQKQTHVQSQPQIQPSLQKQHSADAKMPLWSVDNSAFLCFEGCEKQFLGKARLLKRSIISSVTQAIDLLNRGVIDCPEGYCVTYSASLRSFYIVFRTDREAQALAAVGLEEESIEDPPLAEQISPIPSAVAKPPVMASEEAHKGSDAICIPKLGVLFSKPSTFLPFNPKARTNFPSSALPGSNMNECSFPMTTVHTPKGAVMKSSIANSSFTSKPMVVSPPVGTSTVSKNEPQKEASSSLFSGRGGSSLTFSGSTFAPTETPPLSRSASNDSLGSSTTLEPATVCPTPLKQMLSCNPEMTPDMLFQAATLALAAQTATAAETGFRAGRAISFG